MWATKKKLSDNQRTRSKKYRSNGKTNTEVDYEKVQRAGEEKFNAEKQQVGQSGEWRQRKEKAKR